MKILLENPNFIVVEKNPGVLTVPSRMGDEDKRPCLGYQLQAQIGQQIYPIHRLDFEVSGIVIFAKNPKAHSIANMWFERHQIKKTYEAWTEAPSYPDIGQKFEWKSKLLRGKKRAYISPHGKTSITQAHFLDFNNKKRWGHWLLNPITGRPHQLRVELSRHGWPIVGDTLYGAIGAWKGPGILLKAIELDLSQISESERLGLPEKLVTEKLQITDIDPVE